MVDPKRIILMTKFAVYDKRYGVKDRRINQFFMGDYVYYKNSGTRLSVLLGSVIALFFYWMHRIVIDGIDIFELDFRDAIIRSLLFIGAAMVVYTVIGTKKAVSEYRDAMARIDNYFILLSRLDKLEAEHTGRWKLDTKD